MPYKRPVSTLIVVHTTEKQILLLERADHPGYWQSVTGSQENEEPLIETALRELQEETGLTPADGVLTDWQTHTDYEIYETWRHRYAPGVTHNREHVFSFCTRSIVPVKLAPKEHISYRWLDWKIAADLVFSPSNREAILKLGEL
ncbi:dihydroneopterin triphosphate diphosphatase [Leeia oryzae]|uniref:dihydroneopterin triphosphate diphosphatase n=1 Tax=Leeia oryzae TaxID=356662 RepID=UPI0003622D38|nr:dihydroneopterin triphosphate diphosphatase [Leeia oryzae]